MKHAPQVVFMVVNLDQNEGKTTVCAACFLSGAEAALHLGLIAIPMLSTILLSRFGVNDSVVLKASPSFLPPSLPFALCSFFVPLWRLSPTNMDTPHSREDHGTPKWSHHHCSRMPDVVVSPATTEEVRNALYDTPFVSGSTLADCLSNGFV